MTWILPRSPWEDVIAGRRGRSYDLADKLKILELEAKVARLERELEAQKERAEQPSDGVPDPVDDAPTERVGVCICPSRHNYNDDGWHPWWCPKTTFRAS